jgi:hypothetical protein
MVRTSGFVLAAVLAGCVVGNAPTAEPVQPRLAAAVAPMDGNDHNNGGDGNNSNWGTISSNKQPEPTKDPCPGGGMKTGMPTYDAVGQAGADLGQQACKLMHPGQ